MRALSYSGEREVTCHDRADPRPAPNEVLLQMKAAGICGSDLHAYRQPGPDFLANARVPGHEPAGVIAEVGSQVEGWSVGDRVTAYFRQVCGTCHYCRTGHSNVCINRGGSYGVGLGTADGADAEYMVVQASLLFKVPDDFSLEDAAIVACQGGTAYYPLTRLGASGQDVLIVSGLGPVGLLATLFGSHMGAEVVGIDPSAARRALAERLGARKTFDPTIAPVGEQVRADYPEGADKLVEASGAMAAHAAIPGLLRPLGMAALVGLGSSEFKIPLGQIVHRELIVFGTSIFPTTQYEDIWRFCRRHGIAPSQVVTERFPLEQGAEAFRLADTANTGKVCFAFS
ncbi:MAG: alcohol dehydrogenase catalytic domain-containing protein [Chloroflexi bacterium]|nr:alcohol dehydrogenase catalytic domain-containing protein [Chloroflexota bacterium]